MTHFQEPENSPPNRVVPVFANRTILITGGTGFVGKVLIEKLLRSCFSLEKIYVIIRDKKEKNADERLQEFLEGALFDCVKEQHGINIVKKVEAISGDVAAPDLALSSEDRRKLTEETEIIYHSAATVRFDESLKSTVLLNTRGTKLMLDLAKECKKLMAFSYISTAYCHEDQEVVFEKLYPPPADPYQVISLCEWLDEKTIDRIAKELRGLSANNYTFSKALAEALVGEQMNELPVVIQRPSAVLPIWKEPISGWTDNINGPAGLFVGGAKGVIRTMYARSDIFIDGCPVDLVVNALILTVYDFYTYRTRRIYNVTASEENELMGITAQKIIEIGNDVILKRVAFDIALWYPNCTLKQSRIHHYFDFFFFQLLPAIFIDAIFFVIGIKPFLFKVQKRIWKGYELLEYYANRKWNFDKETGIAARSLLNETERQMFKADAEGLDVYEYFVQCTLAVRRHMMKERDEDLPRALRRMKMLRFLDFFCKTLFVVLVCYYIYKWLF